MFAALATAASSAEIAKEYQVKAAFLYNFTKFVDWPERCFSGPQAPLVIAVVGRNPFGEELERLVRDRKAAGRPIVALPLASFDPAATVHLLFVAAGEEKKIEPHLGVLQRAGVLTIGESERFTALGGILTFTRRDDQVRFEINSGSAGESGLKISAQLLKLATTVRK